MTEQPMHSKDTYQREVEVTGRVLAVNIPKGQCQLWLDDSTYIHLAFTEKQEPCIANALTSHKHRELTALGVGEFTPDGTLKRIVRADRLSLSYEHKNPNPNGSTARNLMDVLDELGRGIPEEELENFPTDLAQRASERSHGIFRE